MESPKEYSNGEITVVWKQQLCEHSGNCVRGLPEVFRAKVRPWIEVRKGTTEEIINQIHECPSGALSFYHNKNKNGR